MFDTINFGTPLTIRLSDMQASAGFSQLLLNAGNEAVESYIPAAHIEGQNSVQYARGFADGKRAAQENAAAERAQYNALIANANALKNEPSEELAALIRTAVLNLVECIVGNADVDGAWLNSKIADAAAIVADCDTAQTLWVHPDDFSLIDESKIGLKIMTDHNGARGSIRIECSQGWIEHGSSNYLDRLREQLGMPESAA
jgi:flagellar assembly protein FliH